MADSRPFITGRSLNFFEPRLIEQNAADVYPQTIALVFILDHLIEIDMDISLNIIYHYDRL